jgi:hypothetical protein
MFDRQQNQFAAFMIKLQEHFSDMSSGFQQQTFECGQKETELEGIPDRTKRRGAFGRTMSFQIFNMARACEGGAMLCLPPQSKMRWQKTGLPPGRAELQWHQP